MIEIIRHPSNTGTTVPDDGLLFFDASTNEYYLITMSGEILTWSN
jgi:hypothetical protein